MFPPFVHHRKIGNCNPHRLEHNYSLSITEGRCIHLFTELITVVLSLNVLSFSLQQSSSQVLSPKQFFVAVLFIIIFRHAISLYRSNIRRVIRRSTFTMVVTNHSFFFKSTAVLSLNAKGWERIIVHCAFWIVLIHPLFSLSAIHSVFVTLLICTNQ